MGPGLYPQRKHEGQQPDSLGRRGPQEFVSAGVGTAALAAASGHALGQVCVCITPSSQSLPPPRRRLRALSGVLLARMAGSCLTRKVPCLGTG